jgi:hypothetical protein
MPAGSLLAAAIALVMHIPALALFSRTAKIPFEIKGLL